MKTKAQNSCEVTRAADQYLCFRYVDSTIPLLFKSSVAVEPIVFQTKSESPKVGFLRTQLIYVTDLPQKIMSFLLAG